MAAQNTTFRSSSAILPALSGFARFSMCADVLHSAAAQFSHYMCALSSEIFEALPSIMVAGFNAFESYALDHAQLLTLCHILVSAWPFLHFVFRAA